METIAIKVVNLSTWKIGLESHAHLWNKDWSSESGLNVERTGVWIPSLITYINRSERQVSQRGEREVLGRNNIVVKVGVQTPAHLTPDVTIHDHGCQIEPRQIYSVRLAFSLTHTNRPLFLHHHHNSPT